MLIALLALLALASFEAVTAAGPGGARAAGDAGRRAGGSSSSPTGEPAVRDPAAPAPAPDWPVHGRARARARALPGRAGPALDGVGLRLEPGERVALVGPSGAGKTTVVNLLLRFLDPEAGRVTLGGRDLREYRQEDVRRAIAVAGQDAHLFSTSIRDNVRLARPGRERRGGRGGAAPRADLGVGRARCPTGWTPSWARRGVSSRAGSASGSSLARALLAGAPVLVLDEPTAHLDPCDRRRAHARRPCRSRRPHRTPHHPPG